MIFLLISPNEYLVDCLRIKRKLMFLQKALAFKSLAYKQLVRKISKPDSEVTSLTACTQNLQPFFYSFMPYMVKVTFSMQIFRLYLNVFISIIRLNISANYKCKLCQLSRLCNFFCFVFCALIFFMRVFHPNNYISCFNRAMINREININHILINFYAQ